MPYVVGESCIGCRYGDCAQVCPQGAIHEGPNFVVINPATCANCGLCEMACPVNAIHADWALPAAQKEYAALNADLAKRWPASKDIQPLPEADAQAAVASKRSLLIVPD